LVEKKLAHQHLVSESLALNQRPRLAMCVENNIAAFRLSSTLRFDSIANHAPNFYRDGNQAGAMPFERRRASGWSPAHGLRIPLCNSPATNSSTRVGVTEFRFARIHASASPCSRGQPLRCIVAILLLLGALGWFVCQPDAPAGFAVRAVTPQWRHTTNGWEKLPPYSNTIQWDRNVGDLSSMHPHPVILTLFLGMFSVLVLVASSSSGAAAPLGEQRVRTTAADGEIELRSLDWLNGTSTS
jgi:hypothetical protein